MKCAHIFINLYFLLLLRMCTQQINRLQWRISVESLRKFREKKKKITRLRRIYCVTHDNSFLATHISIHLKKKREKTAVNETVANLIVCKFENFTHLFRIYVLISLLTSTFSPCIFVCVFVVYVCVQFFPLNSVFVYLVVVSLCFCASSVQIMLCKVPQVRKLSLDLSFAISI